MKATLRRRAVAQRDTADIEVRRGRHEMILEWSWRSTGRDACVRAHVDLCLATTRELAAVG